MTSYMNIILSTNHSFLGRWDPLWFIHADHPPHTLLWMDGLGQIHMGTTMYLQVGEVLSLMDYPFQALPTYTNGWMMGELPVWCGSVQVCMWVRDGSFNCLAGWLEEPSPASYSYCKAQVEGTAFSLLVVDKDWEIQPTVLPLDLVAPQHHPHECGWVLGSESQRERKRRLMILYIFSSHSCVWSCVTLSGGLLRERSF